MTRNTLQDLIDSVDVKVSHLSDYSVELHTFQGWYNPLGYYQRLRELNVPKHKAQELCKVYENEVYKPLMHYLKNDKI